MRFTCKDLEKGCIIEGKSHSKKYQVEDVIGSGESSKVFSGFCISDRSLVALKQIPTSLIQLWEKIGENRSIPSEVAFLQRLQKTNGVLAMLDYAVNDDSHIIIMERPAIYTELWKYFEDAKTSRTENVLKEFIRQAINICASVLEEGIQHRDIHANNFLVIEENGVPTLKLIDFGIASWVIVDEDVISGVADNIGELVTLLMSYMDKSLIRDEYIVANFIKLCCCSTEPKVKWYNLREQLLLHPWLS